MWDIVTLLLLGGGIWVGIRSILRSRPQVRQSSNRLQDWQDAAKSCGLQVTEATPALYPRLMARAGPVEVRIDTREDNRQATRIVIEAPWPPYLQGVRIRPQPFSWSRDIRIGDESFDHAFFIEGPAQLLFALLDADTRQLLLAVRAAGWLEISPGQIWAVVNRDEQIPVVLPFLLEICKRFSTPIEIRRRLVENAKRDSDGGVRLQNLLLLVRELPGEPDTIEALLTACSDPSPLIRLRAAKEWGAKGRDALVELGHGLEDDTVSAEAVSILGRELPLERAKALLDRAWSTGRLQTALACLEVLGRSGAAAVDPLAEVLALQNVELATAAARALGAIGSPAAEPALILALVREQYDLQVAAANALGRVGSAAAVLPLKETAERFWLYPELRRATRQAIAEIQSRLPGASSGQLSLAGDEVGQLSLAQAEAGQLSLAADAGGQLSLTPREPGQLSLSDAEDGLKPSPDIC